MMPPTYLLYHLSLTSTVLSAAVARAPLPCGRSATARPRARARGATAVLPPYLPMLKGAEAVQKAPYLPIRIANL